MKIGMICYASVGGSGIVATELAKGLARRQHDVHLVSSDAPFRLGPYQAGLSFHRVLTPSYPLFREPQYLLSLATKIVQLSREFGLEIVHAHYAIPHATAAYLAKQILSAVPGGHVPKIITTLHGTDITLLGGDPSYAETVAFSIDRSDSVTAVSESLKADTYRALPVQTEIRVIPNFLDCDVHRRRPVRGLRKRLCPAGYDKLVVHTSNFRPVKRVEAVVDVFAKIRERVRARLLLIGDGPDLEVALRRARETNVAAHVEALGEQDQIVPLLSSADLFLLPSVQESFGLAALEAMACEVPVVASRVGGLPEVIEHGASGFLHDPGDLEGMAASAVAILTDSELRQRVASAGLRRVRRHFCADLVVPRYEAIYAEALET
jgi:N-acetyl-alpha-D-glucosaminyl L-malate synthase BshA